MFLAGLTVAILGALGIRRLGGRMRWLAAVDHRGRPGRGRDRGGAGRHRPARPARHDRHPGAARRGRRPARPLHAGLQPHPDPDLRAPRLRGLPARRDRRGRTRAQPSSPACPARPPGSARSPRSTSRNPATASTSPRMFPARRSSSSPSRCPGSPAGPAPSSLPTWRRAWDCSWRPTSSWAALTSQPAPRRARPSSRSSRARSGSRRPSKAATWPRCTASCCRSPAARPLGGQAVRGADARRPPRLAGGAPGRAAGRPRHAGAAAMTAVAVRLVRLHAVEPPRSGRPGPAGGLRGRIAGHAVRALGRLRRAAAAADLRGRLRRHHRGHGRQPVRRA